MSRVQSIERAFAVLGALAGGPLGVTEVADRVRLPKSTVARLLAALAAEGAVEQVPGDQRYRIGGRIVALGGGAVPGTSIVGIARPHLAELAATVGEAAALAVPDGFRVHYLDQVDTSNAVRARDWTGTRVPMHAVPSGQVLLAHMPAPDLARFLAEPRERFTPRTLVDAAALLERLGAVRRAGHAWMREEFDVGINAVAAPVMRGGIAVASVQVHGPSYRFPARGREAAVAVRVMAAAERISIRLVRT